MRLHLIGGFYGKPAEYRQVVNVTIETLLERMLREAGVSVTTGYHRWPVPGDAELVHLHHLGRLHRSVWLHPHRLVYTPHLATRETSPVRRMYARALGRRAAAVIALSEAEAGFQIASLGVPASKVHVVRNAVNDSVFAFRPPTARPARPPVLLLYVGQLVRHKRLDVVLRAMSAVRDEVDLRLSLIYQVAEIEADLLALVDELGLTDRVRFLGGRTQEQIADAHGSHHVLVLASEREALPNCITESLLSGTLVVAHAVGGVAEQLAGTDSILLARPDVTTMVEAFRTLPATLLAHTDAVAEHARRLTVERFSARAMLTAHLDIYRRVLGKAE